jgi:hypothetical protein
VQLTAKQEPSDPKGRISSAMTEISPNPRKTSIHFLFIIFAIGIAPSSNALTATCTTLTGTALVPLSPAPVNLTGTGAFPPVPVKVTGKDLAVPPAICATLTGIGC